LALENRRSGHIADPGAELLESVSSFWSRYDRVILGGLGVIAVVTVAAVFTLRSRSAQEDEASGKLAEANVLFWQGDYVRAEERAKQVATDFGSTPSGADAQRLAGDAAYWTGNFKGAIDYYQKYLAKVRSGLLANAARRSLAYAYESNQQFAQAVPIYDQLVGVFDRESSSEFLMAGARCSAQLKQPAEATKRLQRILDEFGDTTLATRAREMIGELGGPAR
jgi:tetratricopeptide (TPR) repeat protein